MHQVHVSRARVSAVGWLAALVVLCGVLALTFGLTPAGWAAGLLTGVVLAVTLARRGTAGLHVADHITASRAVLAGGVAALVVDGIGGPEESGTVRATTLVAIWSFACPNSF